MDFYKVPIGFGMALAMDPPALNAYSSMSDAQKQVLLNKAHNAKSAGKCMRLCEALPNEPRQG